MTNFNVVRKLVDETALQAGRNPDSIMLIGISKRQPVERLVSAVHEGLREIGENRIQEVQDKKPVVENILHNSGVDISLLRWHMVGRLQSNKAAKAAALFDVIQSVENVKTAVKLSKAAIELGKTLEIFIEVNTSGEDAKGGVHPEALIDLVGEIQLLSNLNLNGLMTLGPLTGDHARIKTAFELLTELRLIVSEKFPGCAEKWELSMGMSDDFLIAITAGSTMVRIGTAIFGVRQS